ncbi:MAG: acetylxylan esterase [Muribaculaceae bacterium]|nr:acetylxylan esterase [Muribaculaceae bacterium]
MKRLICLSFIILSLCCVAARVTDVIDLRIAPANGDWVTSTGTDVEFKVMLTESNIGIKDAKVKYEISEDLMSPRKTGEVKVKNGEAVIKAGTMKQPGFLRCKVTFIDNSKTYSAMGTIGFSPEKIKPVTKYPSDFMEFWNKNIDQARKPVLNPEMTLLPEKCTKTVDVYQVSYSVSTSGKRFYGMLAMPKAPGKYPAMVQYPGAGVYAIDAPVSYAEQGIIAMAVGIHAIPNNLDASLYNAIGNGILSDYPSINIDRVDDYYYQQVIRGAVRAIDFIETLPEFNGCVATYGGSQGGFLSIAVASLHPSVKYVVANFPAMSDLAGYTEGRAGGWPHTFKNKANHTPLLLKNMSYYDTVNFARHINVPGFYSFGFNDLTCAPTTTYSVYNTVTAPKTLYTPPLSGHFLLTEQADAERKALIDFLKLCK